jgi:coenzyme F420-dependent glucose-6-phosphate dehydrogenase
MARVPGALCETAEAVRLMRKLWSEDRVTYDGTSYKTNNATIYDNPQVVFRCSSLPADSRWPGMQGVWATA